MLVLAHTNALGIDLHQLRQWVLQTARNRSCPAQAHIHIGHFLRGKFAGRVDRSPRFADHHLGDVFFSLGRQFDQIGGQLVRLTAACAIANGNQVHAMLFHQLGQGVQRAFPVFARLVRVNGRGVHQLAVAVHHGHFHTGANAGVQAHYGLGSGRRSQQQITQVVAKYLNGHLLCVFAQAAEQITLGRQAQLHAPCPRHALTQQVVGCALAVAPPQMQGDSALSHARLTRFWLHRLYQLGFQNFQRTPAEHRQCTVRGHTANGLVVFKVIAELGHFGVVLVLGFDLFRLEQALFPQPFTQRLHQSGVFGPAFAQDVTHAIQHREGGGKIWAGLAIVQHRGGLAESFGFLVGVQAGVGKQLVSQRLYTKLFGNLALGAALLLERQVNVFQLLFGGRIRNRQAQCIGQLALLINGFQHRAAAVFQLTQVRQAGLQFAQLHVIQATGDFLAVAGNKGHGGTTVQQFHRSVHLLRTDFDLCGNLPNDFLHALRAPRRWFTESGQVCHRHLHLLHFGCKQMHIHTFDSY